MKNIFPFIFILINTAAYSQTIIPDISARVDTSKTVIKSVYHLYKNYINSKPDSIYKNPYWNDKEADQLLKSKIFKIDRSANQMYNYYNSVQYLSYYTPKILQIDSIASNRYQIKTLFAHDCAEKEYKNSTPDFITKLYAVKNENEEFKLENVISYDTKNWKKYKAKFITYIVHPNCSFDKKEAVKAVRFCEKIANQFNLKIEPFTYYILPNSDEMGKLYNFEYWLSYLGGQALIPYKEIFTTYGNASYPHEFVHMLFPLPKDNSLYCPMIINEGLATWLAGPSFNESFEDSLKQTSKTFQKQKGISLDDIMTFKFRNDFDNSILYVTGGVICKLVYEKHGEKGIWELYNSTKDNFNVTLEKLFEKPFDDVEKMIIKYITDYDNAK
ncbi:hypothetical protein [Flavobacterium sandaracinum]|uniref:Peptidase MA-like domain-containing protein n=1 Tax=Flavobacterium sandaracinum TaxID=2541733 RepID=A0A4R5CMA9_9FLAO|nr:hypothetical protein [Flavobacterium sandaracinum]TDE00360.1 hypothetical protein E0F91_16450 [Flavobacterium sandaracinum]